MTVHTNAVIFYGYCWDDQPEDYELDLEIEEGVPGIGWAGANEESYGEPVRADMHCVLKIPYPVYLY